MKAAYLAATLLAFAAAQASAQILTFDGPICNNGSACGNFSRIDSTYGDIAGVVDVQYEDLNSPSEHALIFWDTAYNDLVNVAWASGDDSSSQGEIFLKPLNGGGIRLNSFDLGAWPNTQRSSSFTILDGTSNTLFSSGPILVGDVTGLNHNHYVINLFSADGIRIQWGPSAFNVGIDNIDFDTSAVPLPAAVWLMAPLLGGLGLVRRRPT